MDSGRDELEQHDRRSFFGKVCGALLAPLAYGAGKTPKSLHAYTMPGVRRIPQRLIEVDCTRLTIPPIDIDQWGQRLRNGLVEDVTARIRDKMIFPAPELGVSPFGVNTYTIDTNSMTIADIDNADIPLRV